METKETQGIISWKLSDSINSEVLCDMNNGSISCLNGRYLHEYSLDLTKEFLALSKNSAKFVFMDLISGLERNMNLELQSFEQLKTIDGSLVNFLEEVYKIKSRKTLVVLTAGQGLSYGWNVFTRAGKLEHRLPMLYMTIPKNLKLLAIPGAYNLDNLRTNQRRLVTPFDLHATLKQIASPKEFNLSPWSKSLFSKISSDRTCEEAKIPLPYCACDYSEENWHCAYEGEYGCS